MLLCIHSVLPFLSFIISLFIRGATRSRTSPGGGGVYWSPSPRSTTCSNPICCLFGCSQRTGNTHRFLELCSASQNHCHKVIIYVQFSISLWFSYMCVIVSLKSLSLRTTRFASFPDHLVIQIKKFTFGLDWVPKKLGELFFWLFDNVTFILRN